MADFLQTLLVAVTVGSLYALIALGYTMVYGILKLINFAHSDVVVLGAWVSLTLSAFLLPRLGVEVSAASAAAPWWAGVLMLLLSMGICALLGLTIERFAYKPIRRAPRLNALITAMGVSLFLQNTGQLQYTVIDGVNRIAGGTIVERDTDPKKVKLDQSLTIEADKHYLLQIVPAGSTAPIERIVTTDAGTYEAGSAIALADPIGKSQARGATYELITRNTALKLPSAKCRPACPT